MPPASANDSQTAAPATSPAAPSSEKMPAPTIAPTPMNAACRVLTGGPLVVDAGAEAVTLAPRGSSCPVVACETPFGEDRLTIEISAATCLSNRLSSCLQRSLRCVFPRRVLGGPR